MFRSALQIHPHPRYVASTLTCGIGLAFALAATLAQPLPKPSLPVVRLLSDPAALVWEWFPPLSTRHPCGLGHSRPSPPELITCRASLETAGKQRSGVGEKKKDNHTPTPLAPNLH